MNTEGNKDMLNSGAFTALYYSESECW